MNHDEQLAAVLEELLSDTAEPDWAAVTREHPALAGELRELYATAMIAEGFGSFQGGSTPTQICPPDFVATDSPRFSSPPQMEGERFGDFQIVREIGRGGMGVVYRARQISLDRIVAIKMILRADLASPTDVKRFRAEAESAARLNHPNIVPVYEVGEHNGHPFFSMKLVEGSTLSRRLMDGPLSTRNAIELLIPICNAIGEAHRQGVLHRDLKPANVLIDHEGRAYVTDFGLAKRVTPQEAVVGESLHGQTLTQSGAILGTPAYMPPEQAAGSRGQLSPGSDVYSLGAILYAMLTGRAPFQAASPLDTVMMVLEQDPLPPRLLNQTADPDLEMIALKCLQKPSDLRYASAVELESDLRAVQSHESPSVRSSQFSQILSRAFRETHHAGVLENWGLLWMWHALVLLGLALLTNWFQLRGEDSRFPYIGLWCVGLGIWAAIFWNLRRRSGPITFVERQIAHIWAGSMCADTGLYFVEWMLGLHVLELSPVLALVSGMVFLVKAGILSGMFYFQAVALFLTAIPMAI
ncbi:MAG: serine/threonine protein kinase, partial [Planctomycetaceae bacterium]|nr:serine/threonine protein kinase [Planctomycetaceae bacterium]